MKNFRRFLLNMMKYEMFKEVVTEKFKEYLSEEIKSANNAG